MSVTSGAIAEIFLHGPVTFDIVPPPAGSVNIPPHATVLIGTFPCRFIEDPAWMRHVAAGWLAAADALEHARDVASGRVPAYAALEAGTEEEPS